MNKKIKKPFFIASAFFIFFLTLGLLRNLFYQPSTVSQENQHHFTKFLDSTAEVKIPAYWKYSNNDDTLYSQTKYDDSKWDTINITMDIDSFPETEKKISGFGWFRT